MVEQLDVKKSKVPSTQAMIKSIPNARNEWRRMKPLEKNLYFYGIGRMLMGSIGISVFQEEQTTPWYGYTFLVVVGVNFLFMVYTAFYWTTHEQFVQFLPCTCIQVGPTAATLSVLIHMYTKKRYVIQSLVDFGHQRIYFNDHDDDEYQLICSKHMDESMRNFIRKMSVMSVGILTAFTGPIYSYFFQNVRVTTFEVKVPFTEAKSDAEFSMNLSIMTFTALVGGLLYIGLEVIMEIFNNTIKIIPKLVEHKIRLLIIEYSEERLTDAQLRLTFKNFVQLSMDADEYIARVADLLYWRSLVTPIVFVYSISMSIFCQYSMGYTAGYGLAFLCWIQLFYICELGESIEEDGFAEMLYDIDWHYLPADIQKDISFLINRKQNQHGLTIGPFGASLNREIFKIITNKIYTLVMALFNFIK